MLSGKKEGLFGFASGLGDFDPTAKQLGLELHYSIYGLAIFATHHWKGKRHTPNDYCV